MIDYLIVGQGIAGTFLSAELNRRGKKIHVISNNKPAASHVAAGLYNPIVLKRFKKVFQSDIALGYLKQSVLDIENLTKAKIDLNQKIVRKFNSFEDQNEWTEKSDKPKLESHLGPITNDNLNAIQAPFGYGKVVSAGRIDIPVLLNSWAFYIQKKELLSYEEFDYNKLNVSDSRITYGTLTTKHIIFCQGVQLKNNPYFSDIPVIPNKGEYLKLKTKNLPEHIINTRHFIIPNSPSETLIGATYQPYNSNPIPSENAKKILLEFWSTQSEENAEVLDHIAGIRPTVNDRRPIIGTHLTHKNIHLMNGLGSRGILHAPWLSHELINYIEFGTPLNSECNVNRFHK